MELKNMNRDERSLLLFFESCAVEHAGRVDIRHMNKDDMAISKRWNDDGFVRFGRIKFDDIKMNYTHWCELSNDAWRLAHAERRARFVRMSENRDWARIEELHPA